MKIHGGIIITGICTLITIAILLVSSSFFETYSDREQLRVVEESVRMATVRCYATEGRYPKSVKYLEDNYELNINDDRYFVAIDSMGSNIMPNITVIDLEAGD